MGEQRIKCPYCAELILMDAKVCRYCQRWLREDDPNPQVPPVESKTSSDRVVETPTEKTNAELEKPIAKARDQEVRKVAESPRHDPKVKPVKASFPWLRIILFLLYVALIVGCVMMERNALERLSAAKANEGNSDYVAALEGYEGIRDEFPFSFSRIEAYHGIQRIVDQGVLVSHTPAKPPVLGEFIDEEFGKSAVYWLPLASWPVCVVLLLLVFLTRILRAGMAFLSFILGAVAVTGTALQISWYGLISIGQFAELSSELMNRPLVLFGATYGLMVITALMTLTRTRRRRCK